MLALFPAFQRAIHTFAVHSIYAPLPPAITPAQKDVAHLARELFGIGIDPRIMPGVNPVHHAEQTEHGDARGELQSPVASSIHPASPTQMR